MKRTKILHTACIVLFLLEMGVIAQAKPDAVANAGIIYFGGGFWIGLLSYKYGRQERGDEQ